VGKRLINSFNGKLRDEPLNREIFYSLQEEKILIEHWREEAMQDPNLRTFGDVYQKMTPWQRLQSCMILRGDVERIGVALPWTSLAVLAVGSVVAPTLQVWSVMFLLPTLAALWVLKR
jgi:hypothetical protein